jgi:hypothetical protein
MILTEGDLELHRVAKMPALTIRNAVKNLSASLKVTNQNASLTAARLTYTVLDDTHIQLMPFKNLTNSS